MKYSSTLLTMPRPASPKRKRMPAENRAAQFAPFAALTGYDGEIQEVCRFTDERFLPGEDLLAELERKLNILRVRENPYAELLYFVPDDVKAGGAFLNACGNVLAVDPIAYTVFMEGGIHIPIDAICRIESPLFEEQEL